MPTPFSAATQWELRGSGPSTESQGGAFDSTVSGAGTDYTQQNAAQLTHADLVGNGTTTLTSATGGFTSAMIGNAIHYATGGQNFWRMIVAVASTNSITVDQATATFTGVTYHVGGACSPSALGFNFGDYVRGGQRIWCKGTFSTISNQWNLNISGTASLPIVFQGYGTNRGDSGHATWGIFLSTGGNLILSGNRWIVRQVDFDGGSSGGGTAFSNFEVSGSRNLIDSCKFPGGQSGNISAKATTGDNRFQRCLFDRAGRAGIPFASGAQDITFDYCIFRGSGDSMGCRVDHNARFNFCIFDKNALDGLNLASGEDDGVALRFCNLYNNGRDGARIASTSAGLGNFSLVGCIVGRNVGYDINYSPVDISDNTTGGEDWEFLELEGNAFFTTGAGRFNDLPNLSDAQALLLSTDPFTNYATGDYSLNGTRGGGKTVAQHPLTISFLDGNTTGYYVMGAMQAVPEVPRDDFSAVKPPVFLDVRFPTDIAEGATGGPQFSTIVIVKGKGSEQRVPLYSHGRYRWDASPGIKNPTNMATVTAFFLARRGKAYGFRWKDWDDFQVTQQALIPDGSPYTQLVKSYDSGGVSYTRNIFAPVVGTVSVRRGGSNYTTFSLNYQTGLITWNSVHQKTITGITKASSAVVTVGASHGFVAGDVVHFAGVLGMTEINDLVGTVTAIASSTVTVNIDSTGFTTYTSGGTATKYVQPSDAMDWTGEFDTPVRFDTDEMQMTQDTVGYRTVHSLPIIELTEE